MNRALRCILLSFLVAGLLVAAGSALVIAHAGHWLEAPAQSPKHADAIAVLGGDEEGERASRALALYRQGHAPTIVLTGLQMGASAVPAGLNWRAEFLEVRGVPKTAIRFEIEARNSYMEAEQLLALMRKEGWRTLIVVSDPPHMRRLAWTWARVFEGCGTRLRACRIRAGLVVPKRVVARRKVGRVRHHGIHQARVLHRETLSR